jgi:uncharacterized small protein (DUF1192 family)
MDNIVEMAKRTAEGMGLLVVKLAERVQELEEENERLKRELDAKGNSTE